MINLILYGIGIRSLHCPVTSISGESGSMALFFFFSLSRSIEVKRHLNFIVGFCWANILYLISGDPFCIESKVFECLLEILRAKYASNISSIELIDRYLCLINYLGKMISLCSYFNKLRELEIELEIHT